FFRFWVEMGETQGFLAFGQIAPVYVRRRNINQRVHPIELHRGGLHARALAGRGRRYRESTRQRNPRVARQMESARRTQILKGEVGIREKQPTMTLREFAQDCFKPHVESTFAAKFKTREYYLNSIKNLMAFPELADKPLDEIKAESITAYAAKRQDLGMEISTVNRELMVLRRMFHLAIEWGKTER